LRYLVDWKFTGWLVPSSIFKTSCLQVPNHTLSVFHP